MSIDRRGREIVAVGVSVAAGCKPCTDHHVREAREAGATDDELRAAVSDAVTVRERATRIMEAHALGTLGRQGSGRSYDEINASAPGRDRILVSVGAAYAVNCTSTLAGWLAAADEAGITDSDARTVVKLATFIKSKGHSHVEKLASDSSQREVAEPESAGASGCGCAGPHAGQ